MSFILPDVKFSLKFCFPKLKERLICPQIPFFVCSLNHLSHLIWSKYCRWSSMRLWINIVRCCNATEICCNCLVILAMFCLTSSLSLGNCSTNPTVVNGRCCKVCNTSAAKSRNAAAVSNDVPSPKVLPDLAISPTRLASVKHLFLSTKICVNFQYQWFYHTFLLANRQLSIFLVSIVLWPHSHVLLHGDCSCNNSRSCV